MALISHDGVYWVETLPAPLEAMREAVIEAIIHRSDSAGVDQSFRPLSIGRPRTES